MAVAIRPHTRLRTSTLVELVRAAAQAPSSHNTQPWRFHYADDQIELRADLRRHLRATDPDGRELFVSLGCALENLLLTAGQLGLATEVTYLGDELVAADGTLPVARIALTEAPVRMSHALVGAIPSRQTTRSHFRRRAIAPGHLQLLAAAGRGESRLSLVTDALAYESVIELVEHATLRQFRNRAVMRELASWMRFSRREALRKRDGLSAETMGLPWMPQLLGRAMMRVGATPEREAARAASLLRSSSALAIFSTHAHTPADWMELGRDFERMALQATALGIRHAHVNVACELPETRQALRSLLGLGEAEPVLVVRLGYAPAMPRSLRRPVEDIIVRERALAPR